MEFNSMCIYIYASIIYLFIKASYGVWVIWSWTTTTRKNPPNMVPKDGSSRVSQICHGRVVFFVRWVKSSHHSGYSGLSFLSFIYPKGKFFFKLWSMDQQHQPPLGTCQKYKFSRPTPDVLNCIGGARSHFTKFSWSFGHPLKFENPCSRAGPALSFAKGQKVNISSIAWQMFFATATQICCCRLKVDIENT